MSSFKTISEMSDMMDKLGLTEFETESSVLFGLIRNNIRLSKQQSYMAAAPVAVTRSEKREEIITNHESRITNHENAIKSPMVGVAYLSPEPGARPFIEVGKHVAEGDTLVLIEAMKTFNPVKSDRAGTVREILVKDGGTVEFDQPLVVIE